MAFTISKIMRNGHIAEQYYKVYMTNIFFSIQFSKCNDRFDVQQSEEVLNVLK